MGSAFYFSDSQSNAEEKISQAVLKYRSVKNVAGELVGDSLKQYHKHEGGGAYALVPQVSHRAFCEVASFKRKTICSFNHKLNQ